MDRFIFYSLILESMFLKSIYKYETKNIKVGLVWQDLLYVEAIMTIPLAALIKNI